MCKSIELARWPLASYMRPFPRYGNVFTAEVILYQERWNFIAYYLAKKPRVSTSML